MTTAPDQPMSATPSSAPETSSRVKGIVLLSAAKFFVRRIPLVAGQDAAAQVELALETVGPFTPGQLYYGYFLSRDGNQALVFAAYRRNFSAADTADWAAASAVLPESAVWLGQPAPVATGLWVHEHKQAITVIVWDGSSELPAGLISREAPAGPVDAVRNELLREAGNRFGIEPQVTRTLPGEVAVVSHGKEGLGLKLAQQSALLGSAQIRTMDVRETRLNWPASSAGTSAIAPSGWPSLPPWPAWRPASWPRPDCKLRI